jgi:hypothetical protein
MANEYGTQKYGAAEYGAGVTPPTPETIVGDYSYAVLLAWDGETFVNEAERTTGIEWTSGRDYYAGKGGGGIEPFQPGQLTATMDNSTGYFDPYSNPNIAPGKPFQFFVYYNPTDTRYQLFSGHISDIRPTSDRETVQIIVTEDTEWLAQQDATIPTVYNAVVSENIKTVLTAAKYPYARSIAASALPVTIFEAGGGETANALDVIRDLALAGMGSIFCKRDGTLTYYDLSTTTQPTHAVDQAVLDKEITINQPWDNVRNMVTVVANRFGYGPLKVIWRLDEPIYIEENSTKTLTIEYPAAQIIQPERNVDYNAFTTFEDFQPGVGYLGENNLVFVVAEDVKSTGCNITIVSSVDNGMYLYPIVLRGREIVNKKITAFTQDTTSQALGPRRLRVDTPYLQDLSYATAYGLLLLAHLKTPSKSPVIRIESRPDCLDYDLLDRVTLTSAKLGINDTYDVGRIEYRWLHPTGQAFEQIIHLQNVLYSAVPITPQPYYPSLPPVPTEKPPVTPPTIPTSPEACLSLTVPQGPNGAYTVNGGTIDNSAPSTTILVNKWFRAKTHPNRTYILIDGLWEKLTAGVWTSDATFDFTSIIGYDETSVANTTGALYTSMVSDGVRGYSFDNSTGVFVNLLKFAMAAATSGTYTQGEYIFTENIDSTETAWHLISGLTQGSWYSMQSSGYYNYRFNYGPQNKSTGFVARINGAEGSWGEALGDYPGEALTIDSTYPFAEYIAGTPKNARCFFRYASGMTINHWDYGAVYDNSGTIDINFYTANVSGADQRVTIRSIQIFNVCEDV